MGSTYITFLPLHAIHLSYYWSFIRVRSTCSRSSNIICYVNQDILANYLFNKRLELSCTEMLFGVNARPLVPERLVHSLHTNQVDIKWQTHHDNETSANNQLAFPSGSTLWCHVVVLPVAVIFRKKSLPCFLLTSLR